MKRSAAGGGGGWGGQQSGKQKDVTAHVSPADHVGFIYVSEGGRVISVGSSRGSHEARSRHDAEKHNVGTSGEYERKTKKTLREVL